MSARGKRSEKRTTGSPTNQLRLAQSLWSFNEAVANIVRGALSSQAQPVKLKEVKGKERKREGWVNGFVDHDSGQARGADNVPRSHLF